MEIYTIGFVQKPASVFFGTLKQTRISRLIDVRLRNQSQLAGFTKKRDLPFFLRQLVAAEYAHELLLAPTPELLDAYREKVTGWPEYEAAFLDLLAERRVEEVLDRVLFAGRVALLCSETKPDNCHRRLAAEYLRDTWGDVEIVHL